MTKEIRQGIGLLCVGLVALLLSVAMGETQAAVVTRGAALLLGVGGLGMLGYALLRRGPVR